MAVFRTDNTKRGIQDAALASQLGLKQVGGDPLPQPQPQQPAMSNVTPAYSQSPGPNPAPGGGGVGGIPRSNALSQAPQAPQFGDGAGATRPGPTVRADLPGVSRREVQPGPAMNFGTDVYAAAAASPIAGVGYPGSVGKNWQRNAGRYT
jgi:hypothetical protein